MNNGNYLKLRKGNFLAILGNGEKMIEIETVNKEKAEQLAYNYFRSKRYREKITVIRIPEEIAIYGGTLEEQS